MAVFVLAAALGASAMESEVLNSERIAQRFGNYGIEVLAANSELRRSSLFSIEDNVPVCRTYAVVMFMGQTPWEGNEEHAKILAGGSIGAVFKNSGWHIDKETLFVGSYQVDSSAREVQRLMHLEDSQELALHVYRLSVRKDDLVFEYATIIESHHPDYLTVTDLNRLYPLAGDAPIDAHEVARLVALVLDSEQKSIQ
jgi:hypothetical protein